MSEAAAGVATPFGFHERIRRGRGELSMLARDHPAALLVRASGAIGPALIRADLVKAREFGISHPEAWDYIVDTTAVRFTNPLNVFWLREIRRLPNLSRYLVVAPSPAVRRAIACMSWLVRPDRVAASMSELEAEGAQDRARGDPMGPDHRAGTP